jgi:hypothetical protein
VGSSGQQVAVEVLAAEPKTTALTDRHGGDLVAMIVAEVAVHGIPPRVGHETATVTSRPI